MNSLPVVVIDNGTGYTKLGYAGNTSPQYIIPTVVSYKRSFGAAANQKRSIADLEYSIGNEALALSKAYTTSYPLKHGQVDDWELMERFHQACIYHYLRCDPEDSYFLLTEPPVNAPENREYTAEIFFESFGVKGLYIAVQAVLSLVAGWSKGSGASLLTGTVVDSGDGVTHVIPVVDGYVIGSAIKSIPIAGRDITHFVQHILRERESNIPPGDALDVAKIVKENYSYVCPDPVKEFSRYEYSDSPNIVKVDLKDKVTKKPYSIDVGFERFLGPEAFFSPEILNPEYSTPLPNLVDQVVQSCPIDTRRALYKNIVLSGGSTMFKDLSKRLKRDIKNLADTRVRGPVHHSMAKPNNDAADATSRSIDVNVISHKRQTYAVWFGGSILADTSEFYSCCHTREQYMETGPSIARYNKIFTSLL